MTCSGSSVEGSRDEEKVHKVQCVEILYYWIVSLGVVRGESESEKSLVGYLKNGAFASLGLGGGSWAYYGSVGREKVLANVTRVHFTRRKAADESTYLIASSNTLFRFRCVRAEHSRYLTALISLATCTACSYCMGCILRWRSCSLTSGSSRKSSLVPTKMMGTPGA